MIAFLLLACCSYTHPTADSTVSDTVVFRGVNVVADRWLTDATGTGMPVTVIDNRVLARLDPVDLASVLPLVPGTFLRDYGGVGGLKSFSARGGSAAQSLVVIDGARLSSAQNGTFDLSLFPSRFIADIRVIRGGASALYGANAINGVLELSCALPKESVLMANATLGSFEELRLGATGVMNLDGLRVGARIVGLTASGSFPFPTNQFGETLTLNRGNSDVESFSGIVRAELGTEGSLSLLYRTADRGVPGAVMQRAVLDSRARLQDRDGMLFGTWQIASTPIGRVTTNASGRYLEQHYQDPGATIAGPNGIDARYVQRDVNAGIALHGVWNTMLHSSRLDVSYADLYGNAIVSDSGSRVVRRGIGLSSDWQMPEIASTALDLRLAVRLDALSDMGLAVSPLIGLRYEVNTNVALRSSASYNFRPPSFNEMYFLNYGTRGLRPERSLTIDVGAVLSPLSWLAVEADVYYANTKNLIVSVPVSPVVTSAQNVGAARSIGAEFLARMQLFDSRLIAQWTYTLQQVTDRTGRPGLDGTLVPYSPPELISAMVSWDDKVFTTAVQWSYTGYRYAQAGAEYSSILQNFDVLSAQVGVHVTGAHTRADIRLHCENIFNTSFVVVRGYPMPGRVLRITVALELLP